MKLALTDARTKAIDDLIDAENVAMATAPAKTEKLKELLVCDFEKVFKIWFVEAFGVDDIATSKAYEEFRRNKSFILSASRDLCSSDAFLQQYLTEMVPEQLCNDLFTPQIPKESARANEHSILTKANKRIKYRDIRTNQQIYFRLLRANTSFVRCLYISGTPVVRFLLQKMSKLDPEKNRTVLSLSFPVGIMLAHFNDYIFAEQIFTISDAVYVAQYMIPLNEYQTAIDILEKVVSKDYHYPRSVIVWPKELINLVDDDVKSEILKSPNGYIALPSVVYALYLLARVYHLIGDREAFEDTKVRFEDVCGYV